MRCSDLQSNLALYADGFIGEAQTDAVKTHLDACPRCRQQDTEFREIRTAMQRMRRPEISAALKNSIKQNVRSEARARGTAWPPFSPAVREFLMMRVMPYSIGVCASVLVAVS